MKAAIEAWWRQLSTRERRLVAVMLALLVAVMSWLGVVRPVEAALSRTQARQARALTTLAEVRTAQAKLARLNARPASSFNEPLVPHLRKLAVEASMPLATLEAQSGNRATLSITAVRAPALLTWLQRLEIHQGLVVESFTATRNDDATITAQATLRRPVQ